MTASIVVSVCTALSFGSYAQASMTVGSTGDSGGCSLRSVIAAVEAGTSGVCGTVENPTTMINLPANTITLSSQLVVSKGNMAIVGNEGNPAGTVISGGGKDRAMEVKSSAAVKLVGLEITGGFTPNAPPSNNVYLQNLVGNGGGILNDGSLTLEHALVTKNQTGHGSLGANAPLTYPGGGGGEGGSGGGIYNDAGASLKVVDSTISENHTGDGGNGGEGAEGETPAIGKYPSGTTGGAGGPSGDGGGIYNYGTTVIEGSTISGNFTGRGGNGGTGGRGAGHTEFSAGEGGDGGEGGNGGKQYNKEQGTFTEYAKGGGGIFNAGSLTMSSSTISGNSTGAGGLGGGSGSGGEQPNGIFEDSGRAGTGGGGGRGGGLLSGGGYLGHSPATLVNVTIYGNRTGDGGTGGGGGGGSADTLGGGVGGWGGDGGGVWAQGVKSGSEVLLTHVTIAGNGVGAAGQSGASANPAHNASGSERGVGAGIATGGRYDESGAGVYEKNSIVAGNGSPAAGDTNCSQHYLPSHIDIADQGGNVTWNDTSCPGKVADPLLGALANNGGLTQTLLPGSGGAAIGAVPLSACTVNVDQRGDPRPGIAGKNACDAGAVETTSSGAPPAEEKKSGEQPGGGGSGGGGSGGGGGGGSTTKPLHCKKGFVKKKVKGTARCVKVKKPHHRHHP